MESLQESDLSETELKILCCQCGTPIEPNPTNMCVACLRTVVDITEGIPKQAVIYFCKKCERYLQPPEHWVACSLESRELLALCLKKLKGLNKVKLVDAGFIWTEPHSRRIKLKLTVQKDVLNGAILQQVFVVEFTVNGQMCNSCHRIEAHDYWRAVVQVRQRVSHKKTFLYLEQVMIKQNAHKNCLNIKAVKGGLDFFYARKEEARKLVEFFQSIVLCRYVTSHKLISHDIHSNTYNNKTTYSVELAPVCKDDIVCLPAPTARSLGSIGQICLCIRVASTLHFIEPSTLQFVELGNQQFWRHPFTSLSTAKQLVEYIVMNIDYVSEAERSYFTGQGKLSMRHGLADVYVIKANELGMHENYIHARTHLGHLLKPGDLTLGFDLTAANVNDPEFDKLKSDKIPSVILVRKVYPLQGKSRRARRHWKLKRLPVEDEVGETESVDREFDEFCDDLEEDPVLRSGVNIYKDTSRTGIDLDDVTDDEGIPQITLQEMLDEMTLTDDPMGEEEEEEN